jgi:hypothetical protein
LLNLERLERFEVDRSGDLGAGVPEQGGIRYQTSPT